MRALIITALAAVAIGLFMVSSEHPDSVALNDFSRFVQDFGASYDSDDEYMFRLEVFKRNMATIEELSARHPLATFGVNKFADRTQEEKDALVNRGNTRRSQNKQYTNVCKSFDLKDTGKDGNWLSLMGEARDQGSCGGCWAFSVSGVVEGQYAISRGLSKVDRRLSPQFLIDCDPKNSGCGGGFESDAFDWLETHDMCFDDDYSYTAKTGSCKKQCTTGIRPKSCHQVGYHNSKNAAIAIQHGPIDVAIDADDLFHYQGGILTGGSNYGLNHAIMGVAVTRNDKAANGDSLDSVTIRNSWGPSWGESGNFRVALESNALGWNEDANYVTF
ncbi:unnamed protein product [Moneuplotes crassus]|uniref:Uncharacterized protein n=2 Tax=Sar TaxID=2698737 RepID=A0AAD1UEA2_EUPCR|nr:unnamed protein product [Moneuplotes crassus]